MTSQSECVQFHPSSRTGIELLHARLSDHVFGKHFHDAYTIGLNETGKGRFWHSGQIHLSDPGCFHLLNPGEVHTGTVSSSQGWSFRNLYISVEQIQRLLSQLERNGQTLLCFPQPQIYDEELRRLFLRLFATLSLADTMLEQDSLLLVLVERLFRIQTGVSAEPRRTHSIETRAVAEARAYLEANYTQPISIETLAQQVQLSPSYLIRRFRQQLGLPPHAYQRQWQLLQVKQSLRSEQPLAAIAMEHGFYDQSHLTRYFKRAFGVTPNQYRKGSFVQDSSCRKP